MSSSMWSPPALHREAMPRRRAALDYVLYAKTSESGTTTTPDPTVFFLDGRRRSPMIPVPLLLLSPRRASLCLPGCFSRYLRFRSGVVRIRSTTSVCLLHGLVLHPCGISEPGDEFVNEEPVEYAYEDQAFDNSENLAAAGADDASADDGVDLKWEFDEERGRYYVSFPDDQ
ncbi:uncharacterized protein [Aegilops tauschii subsp. strangulata]|uniref:uncharacterized protein n=1 Tax=Aegilops tauschii subsp. strangulata TaxID=200361 RepID=UPI003CC8CF5B